MSIDKQIELGIGDIESLQESIGWQAFTDDVMARQRSVQVDIESGYVTIKERNVDSVSYMRPITNEETWFLRGRMAEQRFALEYISNAKRNEQERLISDGNRDDE